MSQASRNALLNSGPQDSWNKNISTSYYAKLKQEMVVDSRKEMQPLFLFCADVEEGR